jgi:hypothetical protein
MASLPNELYLTWLPLLNHLSASVEDFADALQDGLINCITTPASHNHANSYLQTAASWLLMLFGDDKPSLAIPRLANRHHQMTNLGEDDDDGLETDRPTLLLARRCLTFPTEM